MADPNKRTLDEVMTDIDDRLGEIERGTSEASTIDMTEAVQTGTNPLIEKLSSVHESMLKFFRFQELHVDDNEREDTSEHKERVGLLKQIVNGLTGMFRSDGTENKDEDKKTIMDTVKGIFGAPIKGLGGLVRLLTRLGGPLAAIGAIISFAHGFRDAESIIGRDGLNIIERVGAGVANLVADLMSIVTKIANFFLPENMQLSTMFDPSEIYQKIEHVGNVIMDMFRWLDINVMEPIRNAIGWMITNITPTNVINLINNIGESVAESWNNLTARVTEFKDNTIDFISNIVDNVIQTATDVFDFYLSIPGRLWNSISEIYDRIFDLLGFETSYTELSQKVFDSVTGFASSILDRIIEMIEDIKQSILGVFDRIKDSIRSKIEGLADLGGNVKGFFGFGDDEDVTVVPSDDNASSSTDASAANAVRDMENFNDLPTDLPPPPAPNSNNTSMSVNNNNQTVMTSPISGRNENSYSRLYANTVGVMRFNY